MRILLVGGTGTIGAAAADALEGRGHDVVRVGARAGSPRVDLEDPGSIRHLYDSVGPVDSVVCAAGVAVFGALGDLDDAAFTTSIANKMMGQVNLVRSGLGRVREGGAFTLTSPARRKAYARSPVGTGRPPGAQGPLRPCIDCC